MPRKFFNFKNRKKAFTLVEVLVVIGIITILSALVITALNPPQLRRAARDTNRKKDISLISAALEQYYADNNAYPAVSGTGSPAQFNCLETILNGVDTNCTTGGNQAGPVYLKSVGKTQSTPTAVPVEYCYSSSSPYQAYMLCVPLEAETTTTQVGGSGTPCTVTAPENTTTYGRYCIENPF